MKTITTKELRHFKRCERLLALLTRENVANISFPEDRFVRCFSYGSKIPPLWKAALRVWDASQPKPEFDSIHEKWQAEGNPAAMALVAMRQGKNMARPSEQCRAAALARWAKRGARK